jgi:hypothetical protein
MVQANIAGHPAASDTIGLIADAPIAACSFDQASNPFVVR